MKKITILFAFILMLNNGFSQNKIQSKGLKLLNTIALPNIKGGFDLMAADIAGKRLFVSAEDNHSIEVIDLAGMKPIQSLSGFLEPKWVAYRPENNRLYVATGLDAKVTVVDSRTYKTIKSFQFKEKCNGLRFDAEKRFLYVGVGNTFGSLGIIDVSKDEIVGEIPLSNFPKQFDLVDNKMYVNIPVSNTVEVVDLTTRKVIEAWPVKEAKENVPMAIDRIHKRLFIGCEPGKLVVYNLETKKVVATVDINKECDGVYYDANRSQIYVSCGNGWIDVINQINPDSYTLTTKIPTVSGAGTSLFITEIDMFILAVPQNEKSKAEIRVYKPLQVVN